ncbi:hypothetical protein Tco_0179119 [Tanacetum coccineum]
MSSIPSESEDFSENESECDMPVCDDFTTFSNPLFDSNDDFTSSDDESLSDEDVPMENFKIYSNPLFVNEEIISPKIDQHYFNAESNLIESLHNRDILIDSSPKIDYLLEEFSEGDVIFLENLLSDDTTHNLAPEVIFDHEPKQNESIYNTLITFSPRNDPLHHEFADQLLTLPSRIVREHEEYLSLMTLLCEISTSKSPENFPVSPLPVEDSDPIQDEIDLFLVPDDLIPLGVENDDSEDEDNSTFLPNHESPNLDHQDNPLAPQPPPEPPDVCLNFKPDTAMNDEDFNQGEITLPLNVEDINPFTFVIWTFLPYFPP